MAKQPDFSNKALFREMLKLKRKSQRKPSKTFRSKSTWLYPWAVERRYGKQLKKLMREFTSPIVEDIKLKLQNWMDLYRADSFPSEFVDSTDEWRALLQKLIKDNPDNRLLISNAGFDISEQSKGQWQKFNKQLLGIEFVVNEPWEAQVIEEWSRINFDLFTSITEEYVKKVNILISDGVQRGRTWDSMMKDVQKITRNFNKARPELIARDQVGKLNGLMSMRRQADAGIDTYKWLTVGDERVRGKPGGRYSKATPSHWIMEGANKLYRWDDSFKVSYDNGKTWVSRSGRMATSIPGFEFQCRCSALPNYDDLIEEADKIIEEEKGEVR